MKQKITKIWDDINLEYLKFTAFFVLLFWTISPIIEYFFQNYIQNYYTKYFTFIIYAVGIIGLLTYIIYIIKIKQKNKTNLKMFIPEILIIILVIISIIASILSKNTHISIFGEPYRKEGLIVYIMYIGFLMLSSIMMEKKYIDFFIKSIIISGLIITILPLLRNDFTYRNFHNVFHQFNHYGYYLMINVMLSAFMFINHKKLFSKIMYLIIYIFFTYLLIRNDTFGCYLSIIITLIILLIYSLIKKSQRKETIIILIVFALTSFITSFYDIKIGERINFNNTSGIISRNFNTLFSDVKGIAQNNEKVQNSAGTGRGLLWKEAWNYTKEHPIFGGGMESLYNYYIEKNVTFNDRPHNIILQISSFIGIPGALIYLSLIIYIALSSLKLIHQNYPFNIIYFTSMCYFISSMFGNTMYYTSPYFVILLGLLIGLIRKNKLEKLK